MYFYKKLNVALKFTMNSRNINKKQIQLQNFRVMKSMFITKFSHYLLSSIFNVKFY